GFPFLGDPEDIADDPTFFAPWSRRNMTPGPNGPQPAPRTEASLQAINAAYQAGRVFHGDAALRIIDWRPYLEHERDMHNVHQSFVVRQRMIDFAGHADNQVIWFTDARPEEEFDHVPMALEVIHEWMENIQAHPQRSVAENRPALAVDSCFATDGSLIARGEGVWDGALDDRP